MIGLLFIALPASAFLIAGALLARLTLISNSARRAQMEEEARVASFGGL